CRCPPDSGIRRMRGRKAVGLSLFARGSGPEAPETFGFAEGTAKHSPVSLPSRPSELSGPPPEPGPPVPLVRFAGAFDVGRLHLTGRVQRSFAELSGMIDYSDEELRVALTSCAARLVDGSVTQREAGLFEAEEPGRIWFVTEDCRTLVGVKALRARDPAVSTPAR
ncbi:hypothetical protein, partial [Rhodococcus sp. (in: high G+C Gram-positive bacteria)]|uniref:hypothetical protein n=1 Tax=Rhodococcus sp. TaxID=1831 RepID=UPI00388FC740